MIFTEFDKRKMGPIIFAGEGSRLLRHAVEEGDEAVLFHDGQLVTAKISHRKGNQVLGMITWSVHEPDLDLEFVTAKKIHFSLKNIFGISKRRKKD